MFKPPKYSSKTRHRTPILFISGISKAVYKYFNYFGPWPAFVQGPPLQSLVMNVMNVEQTTSIGQPASLRPAATGGRRPCPVKNLKFLVLSRTSDRQRRIKNLSSCRIRLICPAGRSDMVANRIAPNEPPLKPGPRDSHLKLKQVSNRTFLPLSTQTAYNQQFSKLNK